MTKEQRQKWNRNKKQNICWRYIYKLTLNDGSTYVGQRHSYIPPEEDVEYKGSGKYVDKSKIIKKEILIKNCKNDKQLSILETKYIIIDKDINPLNLNFNLGGAQWGVYKYGKLHSDEIVDILKQRAKERWENPEVREKLENARKNQNTPEIKAKIKATVHKTCDDPEWKKQHSEKIKQALSKPETRHKLDLMYASRRGKPGPNLGKKHSEERKLKNSQIQKEAYNLYLEYKDQLKGMKFIHFRHLLRGIRDKQKQIKKLNEYINEIK